MGLAPIKNVEWPWGAPIRNGCRERASPVAEGLFTLQKVGPALASEADVPTREAALLCRDLSLRGFGEGKETPAYSTRELCKVVAQLEVR